VKYLLFTCLLCFYLNIFAQVDTVFINQEDYIVKLKTDSCTFPKPEYYKQPDNWALLGNPDRLCDRSYYKNGVLFNTKKTYDIGYVYVAYDSMQHIRQQIIKLKHNNTFISLEMSDEERVFWSNILSDSTTKIFYQRNGCLQELILPTSQANVFFHIHFLKTGLISSYGLMINNNGNFQRTGTWYDYNVFCDCLQKSMYSPSANQPKKKQ
jgi:hypothetical protein